MEKKQGAIFLRVFSVIANQYTCNGFTEWTELSATVTGLSFLSNHSLHMFCVECPFHITPSMTSQADLTDFGHLQMEKVTHW